MKKKYSFITKTYFMTHRISIIVDIILRKILLLFNVCFVGFWLGLLKKETLHLIDEKYYHNEKFYHIEEYNRSGLKDWEQKILNKYFLKCKSILIAAVGGGREVLALRQKGFEVYGFECNHTLIECANNLLKKEGFVPNIQFVPRDQAPDSTQKKYDGLIIGWGAYMLIQEKDQRISFLTNLRSQTQKQSPILLSFFYRNNESNFKIVKKIADIFRKILKRKPLELGDYLIPNYAHFFTKEEIKSELNAGGFELEYYGTDEYGHAVGFARPY